MQIAYTGWTWLVHHEDNYRFEFEQFLKAMRDLGYPYLENFAFIKRYFDGDADAIAALLQKYGLKMANLYLHYTDDDEKDYQSAVEYVEFMKKLGAAYMNLQGVMWEEAPNLRPTNRERILAYAALSNRIGKLCADNGIKACFHPHANTPVFTPEQIDLFLENTDPSLVHLCLDTGHTVLAGMDVVTAVKRYLPRIGYMHLKDVDPRRGRLPGLADGPLPAAGHGHGGLPRRLQGAAGGRLRRHALRGAGQPARVRLPRRHGFPQLPAQRPRAVSRGSRLAAGAPPQGRPPRRRSAKIALILLRSGQFLR